FRFDHVYPEQFFIDTVYDDEEHAPTWIKTRIGRREYDAVRNQLDPAEAKKGVTLVFSRSLPYRFFGRVLDVRGHPLPDVEVTIKLSRHWPPETFEDDHSSRHMTTNDRGEFDFHVRWRFSPFLWVKAPGYEKEITFFDRDNAKVPNLP